MTNARPPGHTLLEILVVLTVIGILAALAVPRMGRYVEAVRVRSALDLVVAEVHHARMLAVRTGQPVQLVLESDGGGCIARVRVRLGADGPATTAVLPAGPVCLRHNGDSVLHYNGRGMLRPPGRSVYSVPPAAVDSAVLSVAGRVRRSYRRAAKFAARGKGCRPRGDRHFRKSFVYKEIRGGTEVPSTAVDERTNPDAFDRRIFHDRAADGAGHRRHCRVHGDSAVRRLHE